MTIYKYEDFVNLLIILSRNIPAINWRFLLKDINFVQ
jgi:hypothetical protein